MNPALLVLTLIGDDRPGLVGQLSSAISHHGGNWLESSLSHLGGKFAGIVKVGIDASNLPALKSALDALPGLKVVAEDSSAEILPVSEARRLTMSLVGHDRIGIVREVTQILARHGVNVEELNTRTASAPMSAETLFHADAELTAGAGADIRALQSDLEKISNDLMVDIALAETLRP